MANTTSIAFPRMFDTARNRVAVIEDNASILNRTRLLVLTEPNELYYSPDFGVGLKQEMWKYNTPNLQAMIRDRIAEQLRMHEPCVNADATSFSSGLMGSESAQQQHAANNHNQLKMSIGLSTTFGDEVAVGL